MTAPVVMKPIPNQVVNERAAYGPFNLKEFIQVGEGGEAPRFSAELKDGKALPRGMICTGDGMLTGIPAKDTEGNYEIVVTAENSEGSITTTFVLTIKPSLAHTGDIGYLDQLKTQVWQALEKRLPPPDFAEFYDRPVSEMDIYYLLDRWGTLTIWDAFNLDPPSQKQPLNLAGVSEHYEVFDRGSCIIAVPKDLYSYERTIADGIQTAQAMAREIYNRNWTVEMAGVDKMTRAAWVEFQHLSDKYGKSLEILNFNPTSRDIQLYNEQAFEIKMKKGS